MKELLLVVSLLWGGALSEAPAPYAASGWRPNGPAFELPARAPTQLPQRPEYLPPVDPRNNRPSDFDPNVDVSVQGLPAQEQLPVFQVSPINGKQYVGPNFNQDIKGLEQNLQQSQYQLQQEKARQFSRQQQFPANTNAASGLPNPQPPKQFVPQPTPASTSRPKEAETTTEPSRDKEDNDTEKKQKTSVEVTKQNLQEYPPELFLSSLAQLQLQPQFVPLQQFGQIRQQVIYQPAQGNVPEKQIAGFDGPTHFAALPSVLTQNQLAKQQSLIPAQQALIQNQALIIPQRQEEPSPVVVPLNQEPVTQYQQVVSQYQPQQIAQPLPQYQPVVSQYQPVQTQVVQQPLPQYQPDIQPQVEQIAAPYQLAQYQPAVQPQVEQIAAQYQPAQYQPAQYQPAQYQPAQYQPAQYQPGVSQVQPAVQPQVEQIAPQYQPAVGQYQPGVQTQVEQTAPQYQPPAIQYQPAVSQFQPGVQPQVDQIASQYQPGFQPQVEQITPQYQPVPSQPQSGVQIQARPVIYQQPIGQTQNSANQQAENDEQQVVYQPQYYQPQEVYQPQPVNQFYGQPQQNPQDLSLFYQTQRQFDAQPITQGQDALQSGLNINQEGNGIDQPDEEEDDSENEDTKATAVATAFGARTQPRVFSQYGVPAQNPRDQGNRGYQTTTESAAEETTEDGTAIAQAVAIATPSRSRSAKLRSRRPRPLFTVDNSGHLVLARDQ